MIDLTKLKPIARKQFVNRKWKEYTDSENTKALVEAKLVYYQPTEKEFCDKIDKSKWKTNIDRKINYLFARKPIAEKEQERLDVLIPFIKESAKEFLLRGSLIWIVQGDGKSIDPEPYIMNNTIAIYSDESKEEIICFIRKRTELNLDDMTGEETEVELFEIYYKSNDIYVRDTFCETIPDKDVVEEELASQPLFIELGKTGDAPLYAYVKEILNAFDKVLKHQDTIVEKNTTPLTEVKGYEGSSEAELEYAINKLNIAKVDGNGGVKIHERSLDSTAIDLWSKRISQEFYEAMATVGKENELEYAQSGKAMDRLFIDMENSVRDLAFILEEALMIYFSSIGVQTDIIWNTDRPVDDAMTINALQLSRGILSNETLLEQHPWVDDVYKEKKRLEEEAYLGMTDLFEDKSYKGLTESEDDLL